MSSANDTAYMHMAYGLAEKAVGWASPNPYVGAVIVANDSVVGIGYHEKPGKPHAEVIALEMAGRSAENGTGYITLEPCTHWGRTPPCIDKVIGSKLKRVVISDYDPNPLVNKKGVQALKHAGIEVVLGLLKQKNRRLNETYYKYITQKMPFITLKTAVSLDGKTAAKNNSSQWISSPATREYIHLLRGEYDALLTGINTIIKDDPRLTVRHPNWPRKQLTRVILDSKLSFPNDAKILSTLSQGRILIFTLAPTNSEKAAKLQNQGVEIITLKSTSGKIPLRTVFSWLGQHHIASVLVEGGGRIHTSLLEAKLADKVLVTISPKLIGGKKAPSFFQGEGIDHIKNALQLEKTRSFHINNDIIVEGYF